MRKTIYVICMVVACLLFSANLTAQEQMPEQMKKSVLLLRPGVSDFGDVYVGDIFADKEFIETTQLDGAISTAQYGKSELRGNTYILRVELVNNRKVESVFTYTFIYQQEATLLQSVGVENLITGQKGESSDFSQKYQLLQAFLQMVKN